MSEYTLKSLARLAGRVSGFAASLGSEQASLLSALIQRAAAGAEISDEALGEILGESDGDEEMGAAGSWIRELIEAQRALLPKVLSAALRSDHRLIDLPVEDLEALLPLWLAASRHARGSEAIAFSKLFSALTARGNLPRAGRIAAALRRLFLRGERDTAAEALQGLVTTVRIRLDDHRFFRRLDLLLAGGELSQAILQALGRWIARQDDIWDGVVVEGSQGPIVQRVRAAQLLCCAARASDDVEDERLGEAAEIARQLLTDTVVRVWSEAARALALLTPVTDLSDMWTWCLETESTEYWIPRIAAGIGTLYAVDQALGQQTLEKLLGLISTEASDNAFRGRRWLTPLACAYNDLGRVAPDAADRVLTVQLDSGDSIALAALADQLALQQLTHGAVDAQEGSLQRLDRALGQPQALNPLQWARTLAAREALMMVRGGKRSTGLLQGSRMLCQRALRGESTGRLLADVSNLLDRIEQRVEGLDAPLFSEDTIPLGGRLHDLVDLTEVLFQEDLLTPLLTSQPQKIQGEVGPHLTRLEHLKRSLRYLLHCHVGDKKRPERWRQDALRYAALIASALPEDPVGRPHNPRAAGFVQLVGFPDFLRSWSDAGEGRFAAPLGLGYVLDALLAHGYPGSGDALLSLLLVAPSAEALGLLGTSLSQDRARELVQRTERSLMQVQAFDGAAADQLRELFVALEDIITLLLEETAFAAAPLRDTLEELRRHVRAAAGDKRDISFMTPMRRSLDEPAEPLLVAFARDLVTLHRIAYEWAEPARLVALRATGRDDGGLGRLADQAASRASLDSASLEAEAVTRAEDVAEAVRLGAGAGPDARRAQADALGAAAESLEELAELVAHRLPGALGRLLSEILATWTTLVTEHQSKAMDGPGHPVLIDRFRIERLLGEGGMAFTYLARDPDLERGVTLKVMKAQAMRRPVLRSKFIEEGKALAALPPHSHVVQAYELLVSDTGPCLVIEYVDGESLDDMIPEGGMPVTTALDICLAAAQGLQHVHQHNLVHLDVKAENIMVTRDGIPKIIDFGLAQRGEDSQETDMVLGTPAYMSPEQAMGKACGPPSDVYSLGATLYEVFTGEVPFDDADEREILKAQVLKAPQPVTVLRPGLPDGLVLLISEMLEKTPENRPAMAEVASRLQRIKGSVEPAEGEASVLARREIAVLCLALRDLNVDSREPEEVTRIIEFFLEASAEVVNGLDGRVDACVGERVFAVFGYPRGNVEAAFLGVRAATVLRQKLHRIGAQGVDLLAGVASGQALVGQVRGDPTDATVLGDPLWRAARLADEADGRRPILVDESSFSLIRGLVDTGKKRSARGVGRFWSVSLPTT